MFHGPTELPWIGCLTRFIWTTRSKSVLTPNINSQTCWPNEISHVMSGTILFICSISAISAPFAAPRTFSLISCSTMATRIQDQEEEEGVVSKSRPAVMNISSFIATSSSSASSPIAIKGPGMPIASGKPDSKMLTLRSVDFSSATKRCIPWQVDGNAAGRPVALRRRRFRRLQQSWGWDLVLRRGTCCPEKQSFGELPCTRSQFFSWPGKSKKYGSDVGPTSPHITRHIALYGRRPLHGQEDLWKTTCRSCGRFDCELG